MIPQPPRKLITEFETYTSPDGFVYELLVPTARWIMTEQGWGTPPIDYITQRGPFQHGETVKDAFLRPRTIQMLIRQDYCNRDEYWAGRAALLYAIRSNRTGIANGGEPGVLTKHLSNGDKRALEVFIAQGPVFEPRDIDKWDEWSFQEVLRFTAYNPVVYDPSSGQQVDVAQAAFGVAQFITYTGTWIDYPFITIVGPVDNPKIENNTTGEEIELNYNVAAGETVLIDLAYGSKTVWSSVNGNIIGTVVGMDLVTFHLAGDSEVTFGINSIIITGTGTDGNTLVSLNYLTRYFGI